MVKIASSEGGSFDGYVAAPAGGAKVPAVVLAPAIHGVDADMTTIADAFAEAGYIAVVPDLFWRWLPGPLPRSDKRAAERAQPRAERIRANEADLADTLSHLRGMAQSNGKAVAMGFCYGGPFAILGPKRLGYAAGISCHGSRMEDYIGELDGVTAPVCIIWGDEDHTAPPPVLDAYRGASARMGNLELDIFPGVKHGFMMPGHAEAFDAKVRDFSMERALSILGALR